MFTRRLFDQRCSIAAVVGVLWLLLARATSVVAIEQHEVTAYLQPDKGVGVALGQLSSTEQTNNVKVTLQAPTGLGYRIRSVDLRDKSGTVWADKFGQTFYIPVESVVYQVFGTRANWIHAVGFYGKLIPTTSGSGGTLPDFDVSLADIDIDVDSQNLRSDGITGHWPPDKSDLEDECETGEGGGVHLPPNMYNSSGWPSVLGDDYKILLLNLRPKWRSLSKNDALPTDPNGNPYVGTLTFTYSVPGLAIYYIGGARIESGQVIYVPAGGFTDTQFGLLTNTDFAQSGNPSGSITATFTWHGTEGSGSAIDVVRVDALSSFVVNELTFGCVTGTQNYPIIDPQVNNAISRTGVMVDAYR